MEIKEEKFVSHRIVNSLRMVALLKIRAKISSKIIQNISPADVAGLRRKIF